MREWLAYRTKEGLSTGEGLIAALGPPSDAEDDRPADGRVIVVEAEFGRVLSVMKRDGSTLGPVLRRLWESDRAAIMTRSTPLAVQGAQLTVIGHISPRELRLKLAEADIAGGTINRLLPWLSERSCLLPHEPELPDVTGLAEAVGNAIAGLGTAQMLMRRSRAADDYWTRAYAAVADDDHDGPLGAILARGPAQAMRLAMIYALADGARVIGLDHLRAGLAVWKYAADCAGLLFSDVSGSTDLDRLADYLEAASGGRTRTEINAFFGRHKSADEITALLAELDHNGDVQDEEDRSRRGRPVTRYRWIGLPRDALGEVLADMPSAKEAN